MHAPTYITFSLAAAFGLFYAVNELLQRAVAVFPA